MKKVFALLLTLTMAMSLLAGCGSKEETPAEDTTGDTVQEESAGETALSGSVSTNGSTSMEKVIGVLSEQFMADNSGVTVSYDPTGSGTGIEAAKNGTCDIGPVLPCPEGTRRRRAACRRPSWLWTALRSLSTPTARVPI